MVLRNHNTEPKSESEPPGPAATTAKPTPEQEITELKRQMEQNLIKSRRMGRGFAMIWLAAYRGAMEMMPDQLPGSAYQPQQAAAMVANEVLIDYRLGPKMPGPERL